MRKTRKKRLNKGRMDSVANSFDNYLLLYGRPLYFISRKSMRISLNIHRVYWNLYILANAKCIPSQRLNCLRRRMRMVFVTLKKWKHVDCNRTESIFSYDTKEWNTKYSQLRVHRCKCTVYLKISGGIVINVHITGLIRPVKSEGFLLICP